MSKFYFNQYAKEVAKTGVKFKLNYTGGFIVFPILLLIFNGCFFWYSFLNKNSPLDFESPMLVVTVFNIVLGGMLLLLLWRKNIYIFGFKDGCLISDRLASPYPFKYVNDYRIINSSGTNAGAVKLYVDQAHPPIVKNSLFFRYNNEKGVITISISDCISDKGYHLSENQVTKLFRRQLRTASATGQGQEQALREKVQATQQRQRVSL
ncbi:hypothetical protein [Serratia sp. D1N4]